MTSSPLTKLFAAAALAVAALVSPVRAVEYPNSPGPDPKPAVTVEGWKVETVLRAPQIESPSVVCALPDGRVLVAEDPLDNKGGKEPVDRILCLHPDGKINVFADKLHPVFGLQYLDGKVYVHQYPILTVFTDRDSVGVDPRNLIDHTGQSTIGGLNDHIPAQIRLAMDGYFYMAAGDRGIFGAKSNIDGTTAEIYGGGLIRIRPDGTDLSVFATGTRNHLDVSVTAEDEMFTYDNTDDGKGWWTRFTHMVDGGFYGYPWDYRPPYDADSKSLPKDWNKDVPYRPYTLWRMAEYGGGSPCGATGYNEDALPPEYQNSVFHCEWGKGKVQRFALERDGGTFKVASVEDFLKPGGDMRPLGISVTDDGLGFWVTDWGYGGWHQKKDNVGRLLKVTWTGKNHATPKPAWYLPAATGKPITAKTAELVAGLSHPAQSVRLVASRRIAERGAEAVAPLVAVLNDAKAPPHAKWHAIWTLDKLEGGKAGRDAIVKLAKDGEVSVRRQAIRQLGERRAAEAVQTITAALNDADGSIRFRAATALGRIGSGAAVPAILAKLDERDLFTRFALFTALHRIGMADPKAWGEIAKGLEAASPAVRDNTVYALRNAYDSQLVTVLAKAAGDASKPADVRATALLSAAELHRKTKPWDGKWWGTGPVAQPRPAKVVDWEGTSTVLEMIRERVKDADPVVRRAALHAMTIAPDPAGADLLVSLFGSERDLETRRTILRALAAGKAAKGVPLALGLLKDAQSNAALAGDAVELVRQAGTKQDVAALVAVVDANPSPEVLAPAFEAFGAMKLEPAAASIGRHLSSTDAKVWDAGVRALTQIGGRVSVDALANTLLTDKRGDVRKAAAAALASLKAKDAVPALLKVTKDNQVKNEAVLALTKIPTLDALDVYLDALGGKNSQLKREARTALMKIADPARPLIEAKLDAGQISPETLVELQSFYSNFTPVKTWSIIGPFDATAPAPFDLAKLTAPGEGDVKVTPVLTLKWKKHTTNDEKGAVDLGKLLSQGNAVYAVLVAEFTSSAEREVDIQLGSDDAHTVYLNGKKLDDEGTKSGGWNADDVTVRATLKAGTNVLVARCYNNGGTWKFSANVAAERKGKIFDAKPAIKKLDRDGYVKFAMANKGDPGNGERVFHNPNTVACNKCHQVSPTDAAGGTVGPSLQGLGVKYDRAKIIESVVLPSKQIFDGYQQSIVKAKGHEDPIFGVVRSETDDEIVLFDSAAQKYVVRKSDVTSRKHSETSVMPEGLEQGLTPQEFADLIAYLEGLKDKPAEPAKGQK